ncbi:succinate dehydrogenase flavoprotein subunit [Tessaracoccus lapidicaptus]|uniref:succinate dehydrogenase n=1 Tax=Tessaracoccus lapidicaptus TaxID=1427523 RepID=A0A1C0AR49_9ACTN|nr:MULTISPECIES: fumarate reductase/succinate dehydrogenase flavoprotein subunit [Tessaracoccus]AQX15038.1 succinate dehydrogenase flavoprotein subunit [Tessaracoccus sp. T2.5-30]OCL36868.1 succinate dehydrogenase flavoprotein subunit [Tessaracoccus lapidicaptus]VEP39224.1 Fumarate reductase flavoprotein subunit [Tessaracoccus lapidicaptus]
MTAPTTTPAAVNDYWVDGQDIADTKAPQGVPIDKVWQTRQFQARLVNPANRRKLSIIVVGTGLAGGAAAATLGEAGYNVLNFCYQDSPRRAHSIAAQGGINAAKNYRNDNDSTHRLFYDTVKGGDYRARETNVYRLAEVSANIIDQCVAQGVPFAREYGGLLDTRSFGGVQVQRTFYARGQTGQQLLIGVYQQLERQIAAGTVKMYARHEMVELILVDGRARGIVTRNMVNGKVETWTADAVVLATGGYGNVFFLSTNAMGCNVTATWRAHRKGAYFGNPCYTQIHPTCIPVHGDTQSKLTLMSESLRNDGRIWVPKRAEDCAKDPRQIAEEDRDYYLERIYPSFGNLVPRDIASRQAKNMCDEGRGVGPAVTERDEHGVERQVRRGVYLDFSDAIKRLGQKAVEAKYGNLFDMYQQITGENPYEVPMRIYPAVHYTMGGLWVDYDLQSSITGLYVTGEANFSDHGANRLGASALMQGLADGYFVLPNTINDYLADAPFDKVGQDHPAVVEARESAQARIDKLLSIQGTRSVDSFHKELGNIMWEYCGMYRTDEGLKKAIGLIRALKQEFWSNVRVTGVNEDFNQALERAGRVADFFELGELMCIDALHRRESCGGHFRGESQTEDGEALRHDDEFLYVGAWEWGGEGGKPVLHREPLNYKAIELKQRSYK